MFEPGVTFSIRYGAPRQATVVLTTPIVKNLDSRHEAASYSVPYCPRPIAELAERAACGRCDASWIHSAGESGIHRLAVHFGAVFCQVLGAGGGYGDEWSHSLAMSACDESMQVGFFPYWKARTRRSPGIHDLGIGPLSRAYPFEKIQYQRIYGIGHGRLVLSCRVPLSLTAPARARYDEKGPRRTPPGADRVVAEAVIKALPLSPLCLLPIPPAGKFLRRQSLSRHSLKAPSSCEYCRVPFPIAPPLRSFPRIETAPKPQ